METEIDREIMWDLAKSNKECLRCKHIETARSLWLPSICGECRPEIYNNRKIAVHGRRDSEDLECFPCEARDNMTKCDYNREHGFCMSYGCKKPHWHFEREMK